MNNNLTQKKCVSCEGGVPPLDKDQREEFIKETPGWEIKEDGEKIKREFKFNDFKEAMVFVNKVAELAESEGHHPDFYIHYSRLELELWTHMIGGLSKNDFILAAKINQLL